MGVASGQELLQRLGHHGADGLAARASPAPHPLDEPGRQLDGEDRLAFGKGERLGHALGVLHIAVRLPGRQVEARRQSRGHLGGRGFLL